MWLIGSFRYALRVATIHVINGWSEIINTRTPDSYTFCNTYGRPTYSCPTFVYSMDELPLERLQRVSHDNMNCCLQLPLQRDVENNFEECIKCRKTWHNTVSAQVSDYLTAFVNLVKELPYVPTKRAHL